MTKSTLGAVDDWTAAGLPRWLRSALPTLSFALLAAAFLYVPTRSADGINALVREDGVIESIGALALGLASVGFALAYWRSWGQGPSLGPIHPKRNVVYLLFAFAMLVAAGEELAWGQRILGFSTPGVVAEANEQGELTLHNLTIFAARSDGEQKEGLARYLTLSRGFSLFVLSLGLFLPVAHATLPSARRLSRRVGLPDAPLWIGALLVVTFALIRLGPSVPEGARGLNELREAIYAYVVMMVALYALISAAGARRSKVPSSDGTSQVESESNEALLE